jgi:NTP pyrophosphatase (non-canonical NTP hydrolase)
MQNAAFDYIAEANLTASNSFHGDKVSESQFYQVLTECIDGLRKLDAIKKALFYGRSVSASKLLAEPVTDRHTCKTLPVGFLSHDYDPTETPYAIQQGELIFHGIVGVATEAGEMLEIVRDVIFSGKTFDAVNLSEECGDVFWYVAILAKQLGVSFDTIQRTNIAKLRARFPNKFSEYDANTRDLAKERNILEGKDPGEGFGATPIANNPHPTKAGHPAA